MSDEHITVPCGGCSAPVTIARPDMNDAFTVLCSACLDQHKADAARSGERNRIADALETKAADLAKTSPVAGKHAWLQARDADTFVRIARKIRSGEL